MVKEPIVKIIRDDVIRNPRLDSPLTTKLERTVAITSIKVVTSASSLRVKILLCGKPTTQSTASQRTNLKVK